MSAQTVEGLDDGAVTAALSNSVQRARLKIATAILAGFGTVGTLGGEVDIDELANEALFRADALLEAWMAP